MVESLSVRSITNPDICQFLAILGIRGRSVIVALETAPEYFTPQSSPVRNERHHVQPKASPTPKMNKAKRIKPTKLKPEERLTILNIKCRSVNNYIPELHKVIDQVQPDIICLTETWLKLDIHTAEIFPYLVTKYTETTEHQARVEVSSLR